MKSTLSNWCIRVGFLALGMAPGIAESSCSIKPLPLKERILAADAIFSGTIQESTLLKSPIEGFHYMSKMKVDEKFTGKISGKFVKVYWNSFKPHECDPNATTLIKGNGKIRPGYLIAVKKKGNIFYTTSVLGSDVHKLGEKEELRELLRK